MKTIDDKAYFSPKEVAAILDAPELRVRGWLRDGRIQGVREGRTWRIPRSELERILRVLTPSLGAE